MIRRHQRNAAISLPVATQSGDANSFAEQTFDGRRAEGDNDFGLNQINLLMQIRNTRLHFFRSWLAVAGTLAGRVWPAFQNVRDINVFTFQPRGLNNLREQLTRSAHEWFALSVFVGSRRY